MLALLLATALSCPDDQVIGLDLPAWKKTLLADEPGSHEQHAEMAALRMKTVPDGAPSEDDCFDNPKVEGVDIFDANLTGEHDKLVQVRFSMCKGTPFSWQSLRIAVLVPLPEKRFCLLGGEDLSIDQSARNKPCTDASKLPRTLAFRQLGSRRVIEVRDQSGSCEPGAEMSNVILALFEARDLALHMIFETPILDAHSTSSGALLVQHCDVTLGKAIQVRCGEGDGQEFVYEKAQGKYLAK